MWRLFGLPDPIPPGPTAPPPPPEQRDFNAASRILYHRLTGRLGGEAEFLARACAAERRGVIVEEGLIGGRHLDGLVQIAAFRPPRCSSEQPSGRRLLAAFRTEVDFGPFHRDTIVDDEARTRIGPQEKTCVRASAAQHSDPRLARRGSRFCGSKRNFLPEDHEAFVERVLDGEMDSALRAATRGLAHPFADEPLNRRRVRA